MKYKPSTFSLSVLKQLREFSHANGQLTEDSYDDLPDQPPQSPSRKLRIVTHRVLAPSRTLVSRWITESLEHEPGSSFGQVAATGQY